MVMQNQHSIYSFNDVCNVCSILGIPLSADDFRLHTSTYIKLKKNFDATINHYITAHAREVLLLSRQYVKEYKVPMPQAVERARIYFKKQATALIQTKQIQVAIPKKIEIDSITQTTADMSQLREKMMNWRSHNNHQFLLNSPAKELIRRCNFSELEIILKDLNIPKKDYTVFKTNIARYQGLLDDFLTDFEQKKLQYFKPEDNRQNVVSVDSADKPCFNVVSVDSADKPCFNVVSVDSADKPSFNVALTEKDTHVKKVVSIFSKVRKIQYHIPNFKLPKISFDRLKEIKKGYEVCTIGVNKLTNKAKYALKKIKLPQAKKVKLTPNFCTCFKRVVKCAAVIIPFALLEYFGYKQACKASESPKLTKTMLLNKINSINLQFDNSTDDCLSLNKPTAETKKKAVASFVSHKEGTKAKIKMSDKTEKTTVQLAKNNSFDIASVLGHRHFRISSRYGYRKHPISGRRRMHKGVDIAAVAGTPIKAPADGIVQEVRWARGYGRYVVIKHNSKLSTAYAHMSAFADGLKPGMKIKAGQNLGFVGNTGYSTGPHLHYEVRLYGRTIDPFSREALNYMQLLATNSTEYTDDSYIRHDHRKNERLNNQKHFFNQRSQLLASR